MSAGNLGTELRSSSRASSAFNNSANLEAQPAHFTIRSFNVFISGLYAFLQVLDKILLLDT